MNELPRKNKRKDKPLRPDHCQFFVKHKNRFCRLIPKAGHAHCGEHAVQIQGSNQDDTILGNMLQGRSENQQSLTKKARVPCPYDTSHTVDLTKLENHMKNRCNSRPKDTFKPYFFKDFNITVKEPIPESFNSTPLDSSEYVMRQTKIMAEEGWSVGNAKLTVTPGELRYTTSFSSLYGDLQKISEANEPEDQNGQGNDQVSDVHTKKRIKTSNLQNSSNKSTSFLQAKLSTTNINTLLRMVKDSVHKEAERNGLLQNKNNTQESDLPSTKGENTEFCSIDSYFPVEILDYNFTDSQPNKKINLKHVSQQASLLGHLKKNNLLSSDYRYVEFGSGKGELSRCVYEAMGEDSRKTKYILVDRKNFRKKWQGTNQKLSSSTDTNGVACNSAMDEPNYEAKENNEPDSKNSFESNTIRLQIDIRDLNLSGISVLRKTSDGAAENWNSAKQSGESNSSDFYPIVAFSKHLCGAATDLALNCLSSYQKNGGQVVGIVFALCCHHACKYSCYANQNYLIKSLSDSSKSGSNLHRTSENLPKKQHEGLNQQIKPDNNDKQDWNSEIRDYTKMISSLSSWATCGWKNTTKKSLVEPQDTENTDIEKGGENENEKVSTGATEHSVPSSTSSIIDKQYGSFMNLKPIEEKVNIGKYCKRFFDFGRLSFVKQQLSLLDSSLVIYTTSETSLENLALIAKP